jgi:glycosyltransferase involved in cell wall biosynthesis
MQEYVESASSKVERTNEADTIRDRIVVLIPVFDDWEAAESLLGRLDEVLANRSEHIQVMLVDDGSVLLPPERFPRGSIQHITGVQVLHLRRNLGHQRAIAIGLTFVHENTQSDAVVVMDADGEDRPEDVITLINHLHRESNGSIVFAERMRRSESLTFRVFYALYRVVHHVLTGEKVRVGNFSIIPARLLTRLVTVSELWNHYAAAVFVSRIPRTSVPTCRGRRMTGESKMNFIRLVTHGLSAVSVWGEVAGVRLLVATCAFGFLALTGIGIVVGIKVLTPYAIPGWATYTVGLLLILLSQAMIAFVAFVFLTLNNRQTATFLPIRDYQYFVEELEEFKA